MTLTVTTTVNKSFAPYEQQDGKPQPTWDVYALAASLYFTITGSKPQAALDRKLYGDALKLPDNNRYQISDWVGKAMMAGLALEAKDRTPTIECWMNSLSRPTYQPFEVNPLNNQSSVGPQKIESYLSFLSPFSYLLLLGYVPTGILIGLNIYWAQTLLGTVVMAGILAGVGAWTGHWTRDEILFYCLGSLWLGTWLGAGWWAVSLLVGGFLGVGVAITTGDWLLGKAGDWAKDQFKQTFLRSSVAVGLVSGTAIAGCFGRIGIWAAAGIGIITCVQFYLILHGVSYVGVDLKYCSKLRHRILILGILPLGLILGGGMGWWLKLSGVKLPI